MRGGSVISEGKKNVQANLGKHVQDLEESAYTPLKIYGLDELDLILKEIKP